MTLIRERFRGALLGLAFGDALGTTIEFKTPGSFEPMEYMVGGGPFDLEPGQRTDDTSMALCLADSLIESGASMQGTRPGVTSAGGVKDICLPTGVASTSELPSVRP